MPRGICYQLVHDRAQQTALIRLQPQGRSSEEKVYFHAFQLGSTDCQAQLAKVCRRIHANVMLGHLQSVVDVCIAMEELRHAREHGSDLLIVGTFGGKRYHADGSGKLVADPVIHLIQQHSFLRDRQLGRAIGHNVHPMFRSVLRLVIAQNRTDVDQVLAQFRKTDEIMPSGEKRARFSLF
jgi:hypothetical protein